MPEFLQRRTHSSDLVAELKSMHVLLHVSSMGLCSIMRIMLADYEKGANGNSEKLGNGGSKAKGKSKAKAKPAADDSNPKAAAKKPARKRKGKV